MGIAENSQLAYFRLSCVKYSELQKVEETNLIFVRSRSEIEFAMSNTQESSLQKL
jgi:hypothetical protein